MSASSDRSASSRAVSFCFDDGFRRTSEHVAALFEAHGVRACFSILAAPHETADPYIRKAEIGDWPHWRALQARGHEIAPHGWAHENLSTLPFPAATVSIRRTWEVFARELPGFEPRASVFHPAYLRAAEEVISWLGAQALAVRIAGAGGINSWDALRPGGIAHCVCFGPDGVDDRMRDRVRTFVAGEGDWLVLVFHGLENEGWGPISPETLGELVPAVLDAGIRIDTPNRLLRERFAQ